MEHSPLGRLAAIAAWTLVDVATIVVVVYLYSWSLTGAAMGAVFLGGLSAVWALVVRSRSFVVVASAAAIAAVLSWILTAAVLVAMPDVHNEMPRLEYLATTIFAMFSWELLSLAIPLLVVLGGALAGGAAGWWLQRVVPTRTDTV
jgi:hypothetical protein